MCSEWASRLLWAQLLFVALVLACQGIGFLLRPVVPVQSAAQWEAANPAWSQAYYGSCTNARPEPEKP